MILVDTSVWIEALKGRLVPGISAEDMLHFLTCGPIVQEVLQGMRPGASSDVFQSAFLALPRLNDPLGSDTFLEAAEIYRLGRRKGHTIHSSFDCLVAAIAIENKLPVWHRDRDFTAIARYTSLETIERL